MIPKNRASPGEDPDHPHDVENELGVYPPGLPAGGAPKGCLVKSHRKERAGEERPQPTAPSHRALHVVLPQAVPMVLQVSESYGVHRAQHEHTQRREQQIVGQLREAEIAVEGVVHQPKAREEEVERPGQRDDVKP